MDSLNIHRRISGNTKPNGGLGINHGQPKRPEYLRVCLHRIAVGDGKMTGRKVQRFVFAFAVPMIFQQLDPVDMAESAAKIQRRGRSGAVVYGGTTGMRIQRRQPSFFQKFEIR